MTVNNARDYLQFAHKHKQSSLASFVPVQLVFRIPFVLVAVRLDLQSHHKPQHAQRDHDRQDRHHPHQRDRASWFGDQAAPVTIALNQMALRITAERLECIVRIRVAVYVYTTFSSITATR